MINALSKLPQDARLVVTQKGYYAEGEFAEIMLPEEYIVATKGNNENIERGYVVYRIGHSCQSY